MKKLISKKEIETLMKEYKPKDFTEKDKHYLTMRFCQAVLKSREIYPKLDMYYKYEYNIKFRLCPENLGYIYIDEDILTNTLI